MSACREWKEQLLELAARGPEAANDPGAASRRLEAHLQTCAGCAAALAEFRGGAARLSAAFPALADGAAPNEGFEARVFVRISAHKGAGPVASYVKVWRHSFRMRLAVAGALCALVIAALVWPSVKKLWQGREPVVSISEWRSPTDSLLRTPGQELLQSGPKVGDFYFSLRPVSKKERK